MNEHSSAGINVPITNGGALDGMLGDLVVSYSRENLLCSMRVKFPAL